MCVPPTEYEQVDTVWLTLLHTLATVSGSGSGGAPNDRVARSATGALQQLLLARPEGIPQSAQAWKQCFYKVLFPLAGESSRQQRTSVSCVCAPPFVNGELTMPGVLVGVAEQAVDHAPSTERRVAATKLLTAAFLHNTSALATLEDFHLLWLKLVWKRACACRSVCSASCCAYSPLAPSGRLPGQGSAGGTSSKRRLVLV